MPIANNLTIAIVTYRRPNNLKKCLKSILLQKFLPSRLIIVDNDYCQSAKKIYRHYKSRLLITYLVEPVKGISRSRNLAIKRNRSRFLAFIDDDCLLDQNWSVYAQQFIISNRHFSFLQGKSIPVNRSSPIIYAQDQIYQRWIKSHLNRNNLLNPVALDTKNVIFDLKNIGPEIFKFDTNFPIFEDTDLGLTLFQNKLQGTYDPLLLVRHYEPENIIKVLRKNFFRGQIKHILNFKWHNYDHFQPPPFNLLYHLRQIKKIILQPQPITNFISYIYQTIIDEAFCRGFLVAQKYSYNRYFQICLVNNLDAGPNQLRTEAISKFLHSHQINYQVINSEKIFERHINQKNNYYLSPIYYSLHQILQFIKYHRHQTELSPLLKYIRLILRGKIIRQYLNGHHYRQVIFQYPEDIYAAANPGHYHNGLDLPTPFSEELKYSHKFPPFIIFLISRLEKFAYAKSKFITFHWYKYLVFTRTKYPHLQNLHTLNWGCSPQLAYAKPNQPPAIVYLGNANSYWENPSLLVMLLKNSTYPIKIFSYTDIHPQLQPLLNYPIKPIKNPGIPAKYQFGLVTISDDPLRQNGFSAKHLLYLSYGLPVLCPQWRHDRLLSPAIIYYNRNNFNQQVKKYSQPKLWQKKHQAALKLAKQLNWQITLKPLLTLLNLLDNP